MPERQEQPISPPRLEDRDTLNDYSAVLQDNYQQLFQVAHRHSIRTTAPASNEGNITDIILVEDGSTFKIYVKFPSGWKSVTVT
jgi:hypothetical protein